MKLNNRLHAVESWIKKVSLVCESDQKQAPASVIGVTFSVDWSRLLLSCQLLFDLFPIFSLLLTQSSYLLEAGMAHDKACE